MAEKSKIQWTTHTFNPWSGCTKVSAGCANCYAAVNYSVKMRGVKWGPQGNRIVKAESGWKEPLKWDRVAKAAGERHRVFCASLADVFEDWDGPMVDADSTVIWTCQKCSHCITNSADKSCLCKRDDTVGNYRRLTMCDVRARLFRLIDATPNLDWLLLTKRPENFARMLPWTNPKDIKGGEPFPNVWLAVSCENQQTADERIPLLLQTPAAVRFISAEPLLGPVDFRSWLPTVGEVIFVSDQYAADFRKKTGKEIKPGCRSIGTHANGDLDWVIVGGESGPWKHSRACNIDWVRSIVEQCKAAGVACFVKQLGSRPIDSAALGLALISPNRHGRLLRDPKGGNPAEWPKDLRVREFPENCK